MLAVSTPAMLGVGGSRGQGGTVPPRHTGGGVRATGGGAGAGARRAEPDHAVRGGGESSLRGRAPRGLAVVQPGSARGRGEGGVQGEAERGD